MCSLSPEHLPSTCSSTLYVFQTVLAVHLLTQVGICTNNLSLPGSLVDDIVMLLIDWAMLKAKPPSAGAFKVTVPVLTILRPRLSSGQTRLSPASSSRTDGAPQHIPRLTSDILAASASGYQRRRPSGSTFAGWLP